MNCFKINDIYDYIEGRLGPERSPGMERHLSVCPGCRRAVEERRLIAGAASGWPPFAVPDDFTDRVMARIAPLRIKPPVWLVILAAASAWLAVASVILIASGRSGLELVSGASHALWGYAKSAVVLTAKAATLLTLTGKALRPLLDAGTRGLAALTSFIDPGIQAVVFIAALGLVVSLFFGLRKMLSLGD
jgi:anti-sigma factor RsiW